MITNLFILRFHLDLSGIAFGLSSVAQMAVGVLTAFIAGIIALSTRSEPTRRKTFHRSLSSVYGAIIPSVVGTIGFLLLSTDQLSRSTRRALDNFSLAFFVISIGAMIAWLVIRNTQYSKKTIQEQARQPNEELLDD